MSSATLSAAEHAPSSRVPIERLMVTVRAGDSAVDQHRLYRAVGFLYCLGGRYEFAYTRGAVERDGFLPLLGFGDVRRRYVSEELFPLFAERIMSAKRPDRPRYLDALDLSPESEPWEILGRSGGRRAGDTIEVVPEPIVEADGRTSSVFLIHGVRHRGPEASRVIDTLEPGDELRLRWDEGNEVNPLAVLVLHGHDVELGYVPDPLVGYVQKVMSDPEHRLTVVRANGPEVGSHLRLLVRLEGSVSADYVPFGESEWHTVA